MQNMSLSLYKNGRKCRKLAVKVTYEDLCRNQLKIINALNWAAKIKKIVKIRLIMHTPVYLRLPGWLGEVKVLCILHHWGVQLILTCSWARPAILAAGKGRGEMFLFLLFFTVIHFPFSFLPYPSLSSPLLSLFSLSLGDDTKWPSRVDVSLNSNTIYQYLRFIISYRASRRSVYLRLIISYMGSWWSVYLRFIISDRGSWWPVYLRFIISYRGLWRFVYLRFIIS